MVEGLRLLVQIQRLDLQLAELRGELDRIPEHRSRIEDEIAEANSALDAARELLVARELEEHRLESEMRDQEALIDRLDRQTYEVTSSQAYTAIKSEMQHARETSSDRETRALELMEAIDEARTAIEACAAQAGDLEGRAPAAGEELLKREQSLGEEMARLTAQRGERAGQAPAKLLNQYERIAARKSPAVAIVNGEACSKCRISIPPQQALEIRAASAVVTCTNCDRILVAEQVLVD